MTYVFSLAAVQSLASEESALLAAGGKSLLAVEAVATSSIRIWNWLGSLISRNNIPGGRKGTNNPVTLLEAGHSTTKLHNLTHKLMAHNEARRSGLNTTVSVQITDTKVSCSLSSPGSPNTPQSDLDQISEPLTFRTAQYIQP